MCNSLFLLRLSIYLSMPIAKKVIELVHVQNRLKNGLDIWKKAILRCIRCNFYYVGCFLTRNFFTLGAPCKKQRVWAIIRRNQWKHGWDIETSMLFSIYLGLYLLRWMSLAKKTFSICPSQPIEKWLWYKEKCVFLDALCVMSTIVYVGCSLVK